MDNRPPPPPHGANGNTENNANNGYARSSHLPPGNYDIFVIPPHSAGSGFLYLPSLQPHRNSFLAGVASTLIVVGVWITVVPAIKHWASTLAASGGIGVFMLIFAVGVLGWAYGKTQVENTSTASGGGSTAPGSNPNPGGAGPQQPNTGPPPFNNAEPKPSWQRAPPTGGPQTGWEQARAETRKREEEKRKREEAEKERVRTREREAREKLARERVAQERLRREREAKAAKEKEKEKEAAAAAEKANSAPKNYQKPTAQSFVGDDDEHAHKKHKQTNSQSSFASEASWAASQSTAKTTPPPSNRGPYSNKDPDKISIKAVYAFNDTLPKPLAQLVSGVGNVTDGLILKITTEGLFIDDDVRGVGQREWDMKAWTLKLVEVCCPQFAARAGPATLPARYSAKAKDPIHKFFAASSTSNGSSAGAQLSDQEMDRVLEELLRTCKSGCGSNSSSSQTGDLKDKHVLKVSIRDAENKKFYFVIDATESWKVAVGLQRLRRGSQVRSLGVSGLSATEMRGILTSLGWLRQ